MRRDLMKKIAGIVLIAVLIVSFRLVRTLVSMRAPGALLPYLLAHYLLMGAGLALLGVAAANQLVWVYVGPYRGACRRAFYIERKREALMDEDVNPDDFGKKIKPEKAEKRAAPAEGEKE